MFRLFVYKYDFVFATMGCSNSNSFACEMHLLEGLNQNQNAPTTTDFVTKGQIFLHIAIYVMEYGIFFFFFGFCLN